MTLLALASSLLKEIDAVLEPVDQAEYDSTLSYALSQLGESAFNATWMIGQDMTLKKVVRMVAADKYRGKQIA